MLNVNTEKPQAYITYPVYFSFRIALGLLIFNCGNGHLWSFLIFINNRGYLEPVSIIWCMQAMNQTNMKFLMRSLISDQFQNHKLFLW